MSCLPSAAARVGCAAAEGKQHRDKKKAVKPLANRSRHDLYARYFSRADCYIGRIPFAKRNRLLLRPSPICLPRPRRRQAEPPSCSLFVWRRAATAEGWARPSLMVGHVGARCQRAQDSTIQIHKPPSQHWPTDFLGSFGQCWLGRSLYRQLQRRAGRK